jgi:ABC-2 type transport system permease protein
VAGSLNIGSIDNGLIAEVRLLLRPRALPLLRRGLTRSTGGGKARLVTLGSFGAAFWIGLFAVSWRVLRHFQEIEDIGDILAFKILSMILIVSFALLLFSGILTSLSKLYLSRDLPLVHSLPIACHRVLLARWIDSTVDSSWMVILYTLPVFLAYGVVFKAGVAFYAGMIGSMALLALNASAISALLVVVGVMLVPANRFRSIVVLLGVLLFVALYVAIRLMRPEQLVNPEVFDSVMVYISALQAPAVPYLPSTWAYDGIHCTLGRTGESSLFHLALSASCAGVLVCLLVITADALYFTGFSRTQTASARLVRATGIGERLLAFLPGPTRAFALKEIKTFLRDQTQWTQLFLIAALIVIYVYNFKALPLDKAPVQAAYLEDLFAFLNMALALFVLTAITARFAFPAVSMEREAIWMVKVSPISLGAFLRIKFLIYYLPLLVLTEILIVATNLLLHVTPFMMALSTATVFMLVPGVVSMGIGFGAAFPDFKAENPAQAVTSFGGLLFMTASAAVIGLVIVLEAGPVNRIVMAGIHGGAISTATWIWTAASFGTAFALAVLAIVLPLRFGARKLAAIHG